MNEWGSDKREQTKSWLCWDYLRSKTNRIWPHFFSRVTFLGRSNNRNVTPLPIIVLWKKNYLEYKCKKLEWPQNVCVLISIGSLKEVMSYCIYFRHTLRLSFSRKLISDFTLNKVSYIHCQMKRYLCRTDSQSIILIHWLDV